MTAQPPDPDIRARQLAGESIEDSDPTGWFERLYAEAAVGGAVPWDTDSPNPLLTEWLANHPLEAEGKRAIVVGCGRGNDAELIAARGFATTAFDVAPSAIEQARMRYPDSVVDYRTADLLALPNEWQEQFDLVVECITVQSLPPELHQRAAGAVASLVGIGGLLVVISFGRTDDHVEPGPPWPLSGDELANFAVDGVQRAVIETVPVPGRGFRWRAEFRRPDPAHDEDRTHSHWL